MVGVAGAAELVVSLPAGEVTVGDPVALTVTVPGGSVSQGELRVPLLDDSTWHLVEAPKRVSGSGSRWQLTLAPLAVGELLLPVLELVQPTPSGPDRVMATGPETSLTVASILTANDSLEAAPLYEPVGVRGLPWEWTPPVLLAAYAQAIYS